MLDMAATRSERRRRSWCAGRTARADLAGAARSGRDAPLIRTGAVAAVAAAVAKIAELQQAQRRLRRESEQVLGGLKAKFTGLTQTLGQLLSQTAGST
jgi:hypothetical protein